VSGWDQKYDYEDWMTEVRQQAEGLQRTNKWMRWMYLGTAAFMLTFGVVVMFPLAIIVGGFFVALALWNERLIRRMKRAGIK
jgi:Flp pilus assembly protein TadB